MAGARLNYVAFGNPEGSEQDILLTIFLRGGCDGLNIVAPIDGADRGYYEAARSRIKLPTAEALLLGTMPGATGQFGLHPAAAPLHELYQEGRLAIVHAAGLNNDTRSHFDAMEFMERGIPEGGSLTTGWLTRHFQSATNLPSDIIFPALAVGNLQPSSLLGSRESIAMNDPGDFSFYGHWRYVNAQRGALRRMYDGANWLHQAGLQTLDAVDIVESYYSGDYVPANGAVYPSGSFGNQLQVVAQVVKWQLGLRVATIDLGGWDTHESQGDGSGGYFNDLLGQLAQGLHALYTDLNGAGGEDYTRRLTVVVMSEFGRRLKENASAGTDHGHGNVMFVLGGNVNGGLHGTWPGLAPEQLYENTDLDITTDYRRILSEILIRRLANPHLGVIFPNYSNYQPLGVVQGTDLPPIYGNPTPTPTATTGPGTPTPTATVPAGNNRLYLPSVIR